MAKFEITWLEDTSDEALLNEVLRVAALMPDQCLTRDAFNSQSRISASAVVRCFGSWSEAKRRAGLTDALPVYTDAAMVADLRRVSESFPDVPFTQEFYSTHGGRYSHSTFSRRFGGWSEALEAAEIVGRFAGRPTTERMRSQPGRAMSNAEILAQIRNVAAQLGKASLTGTDIAANSVINQGLLKSRFGGVSKALRHAGIEQGKMGRRYTEDEVFQNLLDVWTHYGRQPTHSEMDKPPSTVGSTTYIDRYGGWRKALKAFVERANSEADANPALDPAQDSSVLADPVNPTESPTTSAAATSRPHPASQVSTRPRAPRLMPSDFEPINRRDPSIGLRFKVLQRDRFRCQLCGRSPATDLGCKLHVDHIVPFSKEGKTTFDNLRALCAECNVGRSNRGV